MLINRHQIMKAKTDKELREIYWSFFLLQQILPDIIYLLKLSNVFLQKIIKVKCLQVVQSRIVTYRTFTHVSVYYTLVSNLQSDQVCDSLFR